jgi:type II secretory pathway pseudopilin PulG
VTVRVAPIARGFTIVEVMVAILVTVITATGVAQLIAMAARGNLDARERTTAVLLAAQKLEQLRSLRWTVGERNARRVRLSDDRTNLALEPATSGGTGLLASPARSLEVSTAGFVDYLDASGEWVGTGTVPRPGTAFIRRWAITPWPEDPPDTLILQVRVTALRREPTRSGATRPGSLPDEAWLITVLTRKAS